MKCAPGVRHLDVLQRDVDVDGDHLQNVLELK
jgi:hypothetical protein